MGQLIDCVGISNNILRNILKLDNIPPLYVITSETDTEIKFMDIQQLAKQVNIECININVSTFEDIRRQIMRLNNDSNCYGIYINTLHKYLLEKQIEIYSLISPLKDVSAKNVVSTGFISYNNNLIFPPRVTIVIRLLQELNLILDGLTVTVIDFENEISIPLTSFLLDQGCNVTLCNKYTKNLRRYTKYNDVIISLIGKPYKFLTSGIKENSIFIDLDIFQEINNVDVLKDTVSYYTDAYGIKQLYITYIFYNFAKLLQL